MTESSPASSALVEDLLRTFASGETRFEPEALSVDLSAAAKAKEGRKRKRKEERSERKAKKSKHRRRRSSSRSSSERESAPRSKLRMDKESKSKPSSHKEPSKPLVRAPSPVFLRTDISAFVEDAKARLTKGFDDHVGEDSGSHAPDAPLITEVKATSLSDYLRRKGHDVPDSLVEIEKDTGENSAAKAESPPKPDPAQNSEGPAAPDTKDPAEVASLHESNVQLKSFPLSKNGEDVAKKKAEPVKNSKAFLPRNLRLILKDEEGPNPPPRKSKDAEEDDDEVEDLVGKPLLLKTKAEKPKIAISVKKVDPPPVSESTETKKPIGEDGEIADSDHAASSDHSLGEPQSDGELHDEEEAKPTTAVTTSVPVKSERSRKSERKHRRHRDSSSSSSSRHRDRSRKKTKKSRRKRSSSEDRHRSSSRRKVSSRRSPNRDDRRRREKEKKKAEASWSWGRGETRKKRRRGPAGYDRDRSISKTPSRSSSASEGEPKIDQKKLFEIARKNANKMLQAGTLQTIRNLSQGEVATLTAGGKSVDELVEYCKTIQKKEKKEKGEGEDVSTDSEAANPDDEGPDFTIHHPYALAKQAGIVMNIANSTPLPVNQLTTAQRAYREAQLRTEFPVSSGKTHAVTPDEWTPVDKGQKAIGGPAERKAIAAPPQPSTSSLDNVPLPALPAPPPPPQPVFVPPPGGIASIVSRRGEAQKKLALNPSDPEALAIVDDCDQQMRQWAESKNLPGAFSGSTGVQCLTPEELAPRDKRFQAWASRDQLRNAKTVESKVGLNLLLKMGWQPGSGLGKSRLGALEPLVLDIKSDRKGLVAAEEAPRPMPLGAMARAMRAVPQDVGGKNPISALMELCAKRRWGPPSFDCAESGSGIHNRRFLWTVRVNGVEYQPAAACTQKKPGKAMAATLALQSLGVIPKG